jgi:peptidoglycan-N-acetylglucosamine deacetylase
MTCVHLTFDDGPGPSTAALLDVLREAGRSATFFVLGKHAIEHPALIRRMVEEGHQVGNHTWSHAHDGELTDEALREDILATDRAIRGALEHGGVAAPAVIPLRLPYGAQPGDTRLHVLERLGRPHVGWTSLFEDWVTPPPMPADLAARIRDHVAAQRVRGEDAVLCLHDSSPCSGSRTATVDAVRLWLALEAS